MTLTAADLAQKVTDDCGFMEGEAAEIVGNLLEIVKSGLVAGEDVMVSGFGKWSVKSKNARREEESSTVSGRSESMQRHCAITLGKRCRCQCKGQRGQNCPYASLRAFDRGGR